MNNARGVENAVARCTNYDGLFGFRIDDESDIATAKLSFSVNTIRRHWKFSPSWATIGNWPAILNN
jgi:hypothetical protein